LLKKTIKEMMNFRLTHIAFPLFMAFSSLAQGQDLMMLSKASENVEIDSTITITEEDSLNFAHNPAEDLYKNQWECDNIRYSYKNFSSKSDTITITLVNGNDHPFVMPYKGKIISKYGIRNGRMHTGTDIKLNLGDSVLCAFDGKVRLARRFSGYGNMVVVRHSNGLETLYGHLKEIKVHVNDTIKAGDLIGLGGRTGRATTEHLHFETRIFGEPFDSNKYIDFNTFALKGPNLYYKNRQVVNDLDMLKMPSAAPQGQVAYDSDATQHVIRKGDNLWSIAKMYNTTVRSLCVLNHITTQQILTIGTILTIR
jgi:hypothetical protein